VLGVYVHIPFCAGRCSYCDFATAAYDAPSAGRYLAALGQEFAASAPLSGETRVDTVYFGGGTPPALGATSLARLLAATASRFGVAAEAEVTCEANPESLSPAVLDALTANAVGRLSLGFQSFDPEILGILCRRHGAEQAEDAYWRARRAGVENVSVDLMYGLPLQNLKRWQEDLDRVLTLKPEHVSIYALSLEAGTPLYRDREAYVFPGGDEQAAMYYEAVDALTAAGYGPYEISNFARPGRECRHNVKYWRDGEYVGFGPSAASHWKSGRYRNPEGLEEYCAAAATGRWPLSNAELSDPYREMRTAAVLGLRLTEGIDAAAFEERTGINPKVYYEKELAALVAAELLTVDGDNIRLTRRGLFLSDEVFASLI
jgi:oxygen-independent coproporphyrinogen-3 oxidase